MVIGAHIHIFGRSPWPYITTHITTHSTTHCIWTACTLHVHGMYTACHCRYASAMQAGKEEIAVMLETNFGQFEQAFEQALRERELSLERVTAELEKVRREHDAKEAEHAAYAETFVTAVKKRDADHDAAVAHNADDDADGNDVVRSDKATADQPEPTATMVPAKDLAPWGRGRV